jgi:flagellar biosynthesis regulator FlaF
MAAPASSTAASNINVERLRKDWAQAKARRDSANKARKEALESLKASRQSTDEDVDALEYELKVARRLHVRAVKEERRLFKELNAAHDTATVAASSIDLSATEYARINKRLDGEASENNSITAEIPRQRKRKRISNQYKIYKERDDVFRDWLSSISAKTCTTKYCINT